MISLLFTSILRIFTSFPTTYVICPCNLWCINLYNEVPYTGNHGCKSKYFFAFLKIITCKIYNNVIFPLCPPEPIAISLWCTLCAFRVSIMRFPGLYYVLSRHRLCAFRVSIMRFGCFYPLLPDKSSSRIYAQEDE